MARELILIPKLKYEQLLKNSEKESMQTDQNKNLDQNDETSKVTDSKPTKHDESFIEMKPKDFFTETRKVKASHNRKSEGSKDNETKMVDIQCMKAMLIECNIECLSLIYH